MKNFIKILVISLILSFGTYISTHASNNSISSVSSEESENLSLRGSITQTQSVLNLASPTVQSKENVTENCPLVFNKDEDLSYQQNGVSIDFSAFFRMMGISNCESFAEAATFLVQHHLTEIQLHLAQLEATSESKPKTSVYDWVTNGWSFAKWVVGTSQNFSTIAVVILGILANIFPDDAVVLATSSGVVGAVGTLLSKMYEYCNNKFLSRVARNIVIMAIQAKKMENIQSL